MIGIWLSTIEESSAESTLTAVLPEDVLLVGIEQDLRRRGENRRDRDADHAGQDHAGHRPCRGSIRIATRKELLDLVEIEPIEIALGPAARVRATSRHGTPASRGMPRGDGRGVSFCAHRLTDGIVS